MEAEMRMEIFRKWGTFCVTVEKGQGWASPRAVTFAQIILLTANTADTLLTTFQPVSNSRLAFPCDHHCSRANGGPGMPVHLLSLRNDPRGHVWLTPSHESPSVMILLITQDAAHPSSSPPDAPTCRKEAFCPLSVFLGLSESYLSIYQGQFSTYGSLPHLKRSHASCHTPTPLHPDPNKHLCLAQSLCMFGLLKEPWEQQEGMWI